MATRLYLPSDGTSPLASLSAADTWGATSASFTRRPTLTTKQNTELADKATRFTTTSGDYYMAFTQFVTPPLASAYNFAADELIQYVVRCIEGSTGCDAYITCVVRAVSQDGATARGALTAPDGTLFASTEISTSARTRTMNGYSSAVSAQAGDRLAIEFGFRGITPSVDYDVSLRFGDPSATNDFAATTNLTTDLCPWVEFSKNISFSEEPSSSYIPGIMRHQLIGTRGVIVHG